jgi:1-acyl-sn-glycerol-3-phosphate acyltransferase
MLHTLRILLLLVHFVAAGCVNLLLVLARPFNPDNSRWCGRIYSLPALWLMGLSQRLQVDSLKAQPNPFVVVANHQSNYDLFVLGSAVPRRTVAIGKKSLKFLPFFGQIFWLAGNVMIDRSNAERAKQAMVETTELMQKNDMSIWVFPEGTRNLGQPLLPFKKGAFQMAINAGVPIVPVCCSSYKNTMRLNAWRSGKVIVRSLAPIPTVGMTLDDMPALMERCREQMVECIAELDALAT